LGKTAADFPASSVDYFHDVDMAIGEGGTLTPLTLGPDEIRGRNTWLMWCGGNEAFWDWLSAHSYGFMDLLKIVATPNAESARALRARRFTDGGLVNEPNTAPASQADPFGLFIDQPADPAYQPDSKVYGRSSGVVGLRVFPNPAFDGHAQQEWDARRYFDEPAYYNDPDLVRPYRVGMSCAFCHAAPHPLNPPADPSEPRWENISSTIGNQYFRTRFVFGGLLTPDNFVYHVLDSQPPGTIDTSLVASDNINNPNTMNAIFEVPVRLDRSGLFIHRPPEFAQSFSSSYESNAVERLSSQASVMPNLLDGAPGAYDNPRPVPRVLLDGSDAVGAWGALARVYLNIGTYHEQWIRLHSPLIGLTPQKPFKIADCRENSVYWQVNGQRVEYLAEYFLKSTAPMRLRDAPGGADHLDLATSAATADAGTPWDPSLKNGRAVFARRCIACHSSKQPSSAQETPAGQLLDLLEDPEYQAWAP
jgi:hypothetical protein